MLRSDVHPHVPTQPDEIAEDVARCVAAGASAAALHVRRPDETATCDPALYRQVNRLVRERCDVVINNSSGGGVSGEMRVDLGGGMAEFSWTQRLAAADGHADTVTLDAITAWATVDGEEVLMNTPASRARELALRIRRNGAAPEWEVFNPSHITKDIPELIAATEAAGPHIVNICLNLDGVFSNASPWTPRQLEVMVDQLPPHAVFSVSVGGSDPFPALANALILGGHIRVGLEDHPWHPDGTPATNLELVQRAVQLVEALGMRPATPDETRGLWGLVA
jgi:uncharacterized protein (DUF849 family)